MSRCVIISACPVTPELAKALRPDDFIIACDAGYRNCVPLGCKPDIILGDFDTAPARKSRMTTSSFCPTSRMIPTLSMPQSWPQKKVLMRCCCWAALVADV